MKNYFFLLMIGLACLGSGKANGQASALVGLRGGISAAHFSGPGTHGSTSGVFTSSSVDQSAVVGPDFGAFVVAPLLGNTLGFQPGIDYYQAGTVDKRDATLSNGETTVKLNYISVPLMLRLAYPGENLRIYGNAGFYGSYALSGRYSGEASFLGIEGSRSGDLNFADNNVSRWDFGGVVGGGLMVRTGSVWVGVDLRYRMGFTNLNIDPDTKDDYKPHNNVLSPTLNLYFPIGG